MIANTFYTSKLRQIDQTSLYFAFINEHTYTAFINLAVPAAKFNKHEEFTIFQDIEHLDTAFFRTLHIF